MPSLPDTMATPTTSASAHPADWRAAVWSEWTKARSLRSTWWSLCSGAAATIVLGASVCQSIAAQFPHLSAADRVRYLPAYHLFDPTYRSLTGMALGQLALGTLGILTIAGEYRAGTIRTTLAAVPHRTAVLVAKAVVVGIVSLAVSEVMSLLAFLLGQAALADQHLGVSLGDHGVRGAVLAAGVYSGVVGLTGLGIGTGIRHSAGAVAA